MCLSLTHIHAHVHFLSLSLSIDELLDQLCCCSGRTGCINRKQSYPLLSTDQTGTASLNANSTSKLLFPLSSVSVLIFNTTSHCFILVKQFRPGNALQSLLIPDVFHT